MSDTSAKFQARSALSGVGFTTAEAETIMADHRRRKIIMKLMLIGNVGFMTLIATSLLSFIHLSKNYKHWPSVTVFMLGLGFLWFLASSKAMEKTLRKIIQKFFRKYTSLGVKNYEDLLRLNGNFVLAEIAVNQNGWLKDKTMSEAKLDKEGVLVLGIHRASGEYIGIPQTDTIFKAGDWITLYGHSGQIEGINRRIAGHKGEASHMKGVRNHEEMIAENPSV